MIFLLLVYYMLFCSSGLFMYCAAIVLLHELGHALFGYLSGGRFISFRVFSFILIKEDNSWHIKKYNIPKTAGQCIMTYSNFNEHHPFLLYHLGGSLIDY